MVRIHVCIVRYYYIGIMRVYLLLMKGNPYIYIMNI